MKCLVTGAPGWLGTRLTKMLLNDGKEIRCLVLPQVDIGNLESLGIEVVRGDITSPETLKGVCHGVSVVFHCAGIIHPSRTRMFYGVNTQGTQNLADEAMAAGVERFIYVSSSSAGIGYSQHGPARESDPDRPFMDYGESKVRAEQYLLKAASLGRLKSTIIRPHWMYGNGICGRQLLFVQMVKRGRPLIFGTGNNLRSLCDIANCCHVMMLAAKSEQAVGQIYYAADDVLYRLNDLYQIVADLLDVSINPRFMALPPYESLRFRLYDRVMQGLRFYRPEIHLAFDWAKNITCTIEKARCELGYRPAVNFREGLSSAIDWYRTTGVL